MTINYTKKNPISNDTYEQAIKRVDWCFINDDRTHPNMSWLFGSDWSCGLDTSSMTRHQYAEYVYNRVDQLYSE